MKKLLYMSLIVAMTATLFVGCKSDSAFNMKTAKVISIGVDDQYPPMEYRDDKNALIGFDVDLGNAIGKKLGVEIKWVPTAWSGITPSLQSKKFDMILSSMSINEERKKVVNFSDPYIQGGPVIVVKTGDTTIKTVDDLKDKVVGVQTGSTGADAAEGIKGIKEVKKYDLITQALQDLAAGRVTAVVADDQVGRYYIALDPSKYALASKMSDEPFGIAFRKKDTELRDAVQKAFNELKADGTLSTISQKWFKTDYYSK
ncbi:MAG: basic amino acid ABC transporter substrate-binding protein [Clostridiaceae bacterium]|nr:basic amino acid ABC transporter substrate-binding protein [Clostridiaceae bacterium]